MLPRSPEEVSVVQKRLIRAGYRKDSYVDIFYGAKVAVPVILTVLATITGAYELGPLFVYGMTLGLGSWFLTFGWGTAFPLVRRRFASDCLRRWI